jgi:hypothetical protein
VATEAAASGTDPRDAYALAMQKSAQAVTGDLSAEFVADVEKHGTRLAVKPQDEAAFMRGYWAGISIDPATGALEGARTGFVNSFVEGL